MKVRDFCTRNAVTVEPFATVREASVLMRDNHVGTLVVVEGKGDEARPKGIVTDRDLLMSMIDAQPAEGVRVVDVMSKRLAVAHEDDGVFETAQSMADCGVRRLPVIAQDGTLRGMVSCDDIQRVVALEMANLAAALRKGAEREVTERRVLEKLSRDVKP